MAKSNLSEQLNRDLEKHKSSHHQAVSKPKTKANEGSSEKFKTQPTVVGATPDLGKVKNCKLAINARTNIVAEGKMYEGGGPEQLLHGKVLGENNVRVSVDKVLIKVDMPLPVPVNEELCTVNGAKGSYVAWPKDLVICEDEVELENDKDLDAGFRNPGQFKPNTQEGIKCSLAIGVRTNIVAKGTLYTDFGPKHEIQGYLLGEKALAVTVDEVIKGDIFLPIVIGDEIVVISDAKGKLVPWPGVLVIHSNYKITKMQNRWEESKKIEKTNKLRINNLKEQISDFGNIVESAMTTTSHVILPLEDELFDKEMGPLHITKSEVLDICNMSMVNVACITTYIRFLYEKLKNSQTLYAFANPAIFDDFGTLGDQSNEVRNRLESAKLHNHRYIFLPYNPGVHWILTIIDVLQMKVYWLNSLKGKPGFMFVTAVNSAIVAATYANGSRRREITWEPVKCPQQPGSTECGYYVMKFMRHFVNDPDQSFESKITTLGKTKTYKDDDLVEVRYEWVNFVKDLSPLD